MNRKFLWGYLLFVTLVVGFVLGAGFYLLSISTLPDTIATARYVIRIGEIALAAPALAGILLALSYRKTVFGIASGLVSGVLLMVAGVVAMTYGLGMGTGIFGGAVNGIIRMKAFSAAGIGLAVAARGWKLILDTKKAGLFRDRPL